jgi:hypothetical protein
MSLKEYKMKSLGDKIEAEAELKAKEAAKKKEVKKK